MSYNIQYVLTINIVNVRSSDETVFWRLIKGVSNEHNLLLKTCMNLL